MADTQEDNPTDISIDPRAKHKAAKRAAFLEHLALTSNVAESATVAGIASSTLYTWKQNDPDFEVAWLKALAAGYQLLEMEMLERARKGVERKIFYHGKLIGTVRDYDHKTALSLLRMHKESVALVRAARAELAAEPEPVRDTLDEKLKKINRRLRDFQAEQRQDQRDEKRVDGGERNGAAHGT